MNYQYILRRTILVLALLFLTGCKVAQNEPTATVALPTSTSPLPAATTISAPAAPTPVRTPLIETPSYDKLVTMFEYDPGAPPTL